MWIKTKRGTLVNLDHVRFIRVEERVENGLSFFDVVLPIERHPMAVSTWKTREEAQSVVDKIAAKVQAVSHEEFSPDADG
jgi:hypothetical protein